MLPYRTESVQMRQCGARASCTCAKPPLFLSLAVRNSIICQETRQASSIQGLKATALLDPRSLTKKPQCRQVPLLKRLPKKRYHQQQTLIGKMCLDDVC